MTSGIYQIKNTQSGKIYIGSSSDCERRFKAHRRNLEQENHRNIHLQRSWNKHSTDDFTFEIIEEVEPDDLLERENDHLFFFQSRHLWHLTYNIAKKASSPMYGVTGEDHPAHGKHVSEEEIARLREECRVLSDEEIVEIRERYKNEDISQIHLAEDYDCTQANISEILLGHTYEHLGGPIVGEDYVNVWQDHLSSSDIVEIREKYKKEDISQKDLEKEYDCHSVSKILKGEKRPDAGGPIYQKDYDDDRASLTENDVIEIREKYDQEDLTYQDLAEEYNTSRSNIGFIVKGEYWSDVGGPIKD